MVRQFLQRKGHESVGFIIEQYMWVSWVFFNTFDVEKYMKKNSEFRPVAFEWKKMGFP